MTIENQKSLPKSKKILSLSLLMALVQFINMASIFFGLMMVSKLGPEALAASTLIYSTYISVMVTGMSILFSLSVLVGHAFGAKNDSAIGQYVQQSWTLAILIGIVNIVIFLNIEHLLIFLKQDPKIASIVQTFFNAYIWGVIPLLIAGCNQQFCFGIHKQKLVALSSILTFIVMIISSYMLIFGKWGAPALGIAGLGYSMALGVWFSCIFMLLSFIFRKDFKHFNLFQYRVHKNWSYLVQMLKMGGHISTQIGGEMLSFFVGSMMVGWVGVKALAAYQVVTQYFVLVLVPIFAISQGTGILIGHAFGAKQFHTIKKIGADSLKLTFTLSLITAIAFLTLPKILASFYLDTTNPENTKTLQLIISIFAVMAFSQVFDALRNTLTGALRGLLDTKFPMITGLLVIWLIGIPSSYILGFLLNMGAVGIALGSCLGMLIGALIMGYRWRKLSQNYTLKAQLPH